jgi:hypothetical protein
MPIYKTKDGYKIDNTKGTLKTKSEAIKRLRAIKSKDKEKEVASRRSNIIRKIV